MRTHKRRYGAIALGPFLAFMVFFSLPAAVAQVLPPTLDLIVPQGGKRGSTVRIMIEGTNLEDGKRLLFSRPGLRASILKSELLPKDPTQHSGEGATIADSPPRHRLTAEMNIQPDAGLGLYEFRLLTSLGTSNSLVFAVGSLDEMDERQIKAATKEVQLVQLPLTVQGKISAVGEVDEFAFKAEAGRQLVFAIMATELGSRLHAQLTLLDQGGRVLARKKKSHGKDPFLTHRFQKDEMGLIRVSDVFMGGGDSHFYRLQAGDFPYATGVFPLGVQADRKTTLKVQGPNLGTNNEIDITVSAEHSSVGKIIPVSTPPALNAVQVAVGTYPEEMERELNSSAAQAQPISWPVTINGRISGAAAERAGPDKADEDWFSLSATRDQQLVIEVEAQRLGSELDSVVELMDTQGTPIPSVNLRSVTRVDIAFDSRLDSQNPAAMVDPWPLNGIAINDYLMVGNEIIRLSDLPRHPDDFTRFESFLGVRSSFFGTTTEWHAGGTPVYKVEPFPPGTKFPSNALAVFQLDYRNDDGGPLYGKDSRVNFVAPADGTYLVRIRDARGLECDDCAYRLIIREPRRDFVLRLGTFLVEGQFEKRQMNPGNFNVPAGGRVPISVVAVRDGGFDGPIKVALQNLPQGVTSAPGIIPSGEHSTVLLVEADQDLAFEPVPLRIVGRAKIEGEVITRSLDMEDKLGFLSSSVPSDVSVTTDSQRIEIVPGNEVQFRARVDRQEGFDRPVRLDLRNLPRGVRVLRVGIAGIVLQEKDEETITLYAEPWVKPVRRPFYVVGRQLEDDLVVARGKSVIYLEHSSAPVELTVLSERAAAGGR